MRAVIVYLSAIITIVFVCIISLAGCDTPVIEKKRIYIVFRFDDYSATSSTDVELRIIDDFRRNEASVTFGVIPFVSADDWLDPSSHDIVPLTTIKGDILKAGVKDGTLEIALHGFSHQTINAERKTEFSGLDYNSQLERITKGKRLLVDIIGSPVTTFVPPWNKYDLNTLQALDQAGFSTLSASKGGAAKKSSTLNFLPATCTLLKLQDAIKSARASSDTQPIIVVLFHEYDFKEIDKKRGSMTYQDFSGLLNWLKKEPDIKLLSIRQATEIIDDLSVIRFKLSQLANLLYTLLPALLQEEDLPTRYLEPHVQIQMFIKVGGFYLLLISLFAVISFVTGLLVFRGAVFLITLKIFGGLALSVSLFFYFFQNLPINREGMFIITCAVGICIGLCLNLLYPKMKRLWNLSNMVEKN